MERNPYYHIEVEEAIIGALFLDGELIKECTLVPEHFYSPQLRKIYMLMGQLAQKGKPIDVVSVAEEAGPDHFFEIGGGGYLPSLADSVPSTANFKHYQEIVKKYAHKRDTVLIANKIRKATQDGNLDGIIREGIQDLQKVEDGLSDENLGDIKEGLIDLYLDCEKDLGEISGIPSGFKELDGLTGGFQESDLVVIGARPSVGKTAFALNIALQAAQEDVSDYFFFRNVKKAIIEKSGWSNELC